MLSSKDFRLDLYYRLNVFHIHLPALRELRKDIPDIFRYYVGKLSVGKTRTIKDISDEAIHVMQNYNWPGNIRELRNVAERALIVSKGNHITLKDLPIEKTIPARQQTFSNDPIGTLKTLLEDTERQAILQALNQTANNRAEAAKILGIHRTGLYQKMKKYGIS